MVKKSGTKPIGKEMVMSNLRHYIKMVIQLIRFSAGNYVAGKGISELIRP